MGIEAGRQLLHYRPIEKIGEGGMGVVWKAIDTTLEREVALKILPDALATDAQRLARFDREARLLPSLNHPNIAVIHGLHGAEGVQFLAMELAGGENLAARIGRGPVPVDEAIAIALQVAEALEAAHDSGIVHSDLKPANIQVTPDGKVKVLDFGLAKALAPEAGPQSTSASLSPTVTSAGTLAGIILGTAAYMSPEQARGRAVDRRADIWAFGAVLHEMLTGKQLFQGETVSDTLAAVLTREVDGKTLPAQTPPAVRRLLSRCLDRDPKRRLRDIGEARIALTQAADSSGVSDEFPAAAAPAPQRRGLPRAWPWAIAALALVGWVATAVVLGQRAPSGPGNLRTSLALPDGVGIPTLFYGSASSATLALSPRRDRVAFVGLKDGEGALYLRRLDSFDAVRLTKTEGARAPFFSPDGTRLAFFASGRLWRIDLPDGVPVELTSSSFNSVGGSWGDDGQIVYAPNYSDALWTIPAGGGEARPFTQVDRAQGETSHRWPCVLPAGAGVLFAIKMATSETFDDALIAVADPGTGEHHVLIEGGSMPRSGRALSVARRAGGSPGAPR